MSKEEKVILFVIFIGIALLLESFYVDHVNCEDAGGIYVRGLLSMECLIKQQ